MVLNAMAAKQIDLGYCTIYFAVTAHMTLMIVQQAPTVLFDMKLKSPAAPLVQWTC